MDADEAAHPVQEHDGVSDEGVSRAREHRGGQPQASALCQDERDDAGDDVAAVASQDVLDAAAEDHGGCGARRTVGNVHVHRSAVVGDSRRGHCNRGRPPLQPTGNGHQRTQECEKGRRTGSALREAFD